MGSKKEYGGPPYSFLREAVYSHFKLFKNSTLAGKCAGTHHMTIGKGRREVEVRSKGYEVGEKGQAFNSCQLGITFF